MRKKDYEYITCETIEDLCNVVTHNTSYLLKRHKKLNRKVNALAIIFGGLLLLMNKK